MNMLDMRKFELDKFPLFELERMTPAQIEYLKGFELEFRLSD